MLYFLENKKWERSQDSFGWKERARRILRANNTTEMQWAKKERFNGGDDIDFDPRINDRCENSCSVWESIFGVELRNVNTDQSKSHDFDETTADMLTLSEWRKNVSNS